MTIDKAYQEDVTALANAFPNLVVNVNDYYIKFEDEEVERICSINWGDFLETVVTTTVTEDSDTVTVNTIVRQVTMRNTTRASVVEISNTTTTRAKEEGEAAGTTTTTTKTKLGMTYAQAAAVSSVGTKFSNNTRIEYFDEFKYFTGYSGNMTSGGAGIFQGCTALKYLTVPNSVTQLVNFAFRAMGSTVRIDLPNTISYMEYRYTWDIKNTTILICRAVTPPRFSSTSSNAYLARWNPIYVPDDSVATYKAASVWSNYASKIKALSEYTGR